MFHYTATIGNGVSIQPSWVPNAGNGLFANRNFEKNELITELEGTHIYSKAVVDAMKQQGFASHIRSVSIGYHYIDGNVPIQQGKGGAAFANDAYQTCFQNNTYFLSIMGWFQGLLPYFFKS